MEHEVALLLSRYRLQVVGLIGLDTPESLGFSVADWEARLERVQLSYDDLKAAFLLAGAELRASIPGVIDTLGQNSRIRHMAIQMFKSIRYLGELYSDTELEAKNGTPPLI